MNKTFIVLLISVIFFSSCGKQSEINPNKHFWGKKQFYSDFLFKKYDVADTSHTYNKTLYFDFNKEAKDSLKNTIEFQLVERVIKLGNDNLPKDTVYLPTKDIRLYKNGEQCPNNILKISAKDGKADLKIAFEKKSKHEDHVYNLSLQLLNNGGLDRIGNVDVSEAKNIVLTDEWVVEKDVVYNPMVKLLFWISIFLLVVIAAMVFIIRLNNPTFRIRNLQIEYYTCQGVLRPPYVNLKLKGCYKVICSNKKQKQHFLSRLFYGKIAFVMNEFWDKDICLMPKTYSKNGIRIVNNPYDSFVKSIEKGTPSELINANNEKVTLRF